MFNWKTLYNCVIGNLNSKQLVLGLEWKSRIVIFISDEAEKFEGIQNFCLMEKKLVTSYFMVANKSIQWKGDVRLKNFA